MMMMLPGRQTRITARSAFDRILGGRFSSLSTINMRLNPTTAAAAAAAGATMRAPSARAFSSYSLQSARAQSSGGSPGEPVNAKPTYQIYGENNISFTIKAIPPEFRAVSGGKTMVLDKKGRLLLEWVPRMPPNNKFAWDRPLRFGLSPEEIGLFLARVKYGQTVEFNRQNQNRSNNGYNQFGAYDNNDSDAAGSSSLLKVFRAQPMPDGTVRMVCDYELDGRGGQEPPTDYESRGPLEINLLAGEYQVVQSIMEYSLPQLAGWSTLMNYSMEHALASASSAMPNPHNYGGGSRGDDVPF